MSGLSLKLRLGTAAALLGAATILTAAILHVGMAQVAVRLEAALAAETRMARYATLSRQVSTFLVVATEAIQTGLPAETRAERITPVAESMRETFGVLQRDVAQAVARVQALGIDQQSRYGTQSLGLARMEALLDSAVRALTAPGDDRDRLRAAVRQIGQEDFAVQLPLAQRDEIGQLHAETNRMAQALAERQEQIRSDRASLNEIIAQRTEALDAANAELAAVDANRRRFFADISHELRTPLTVILMEAQIGKRGGEAPWVAFATIEARAARLNRRIDDLLRVARSDSGQLGLEARAVCLRDLADEVIEEVRAEIANAGMTLETGPVPDETVTGDANWLRQVLAGLVRNAIRHACDGGLVRLSAEAEGPAPGCR